MYSDKWIVFLRKIVIAVFVIFVLAGFVFGIADAMRGFVDVIYDDSLVDFLFWILIFGIPAIIDLAVGMAVVDFLTNVHNIRENVSKIKAEICEAKKTNYNNTTNTQRSKEFTSSKTVVKEGRIVCNMCGTEQSESRQFCSNCGAKFI